MGDFKQQSIAVHRSDPTNVDKIGYCPCYGCCYLLMKCGTTSLIWKTNPVL
jgi:hypothetical protein